ncbi:uncharacterized protein [Asterias amurensis]|uniref:uncharacterized protein isoform X1 n=1 Tax=Asterias amurensis TaxID=7602 RepID=UPI003AB2E0EB
MQNQNNNVAMMSRQSGSRSGTPNSMIVLEQGRSSPTRPSSSTSKRPARPSPIKRGGSSLEILPADEEEISRSACRLSTNSVNDEGSRQTHSAGSHSRLGFHDEQQGRQYEAAGNRQRGHGEMKRSSSVEMDRMTPESPRRQVYLPTVKRNFEQHGMPINEELAKAVQNRSILQNGSIIPSSSIHTSTDSPHRKQQGQRLNTQETDAGTSNESSKDSVGLDERLEQLTVKETEGQRADVKVQGEPAKEAVETDSYYVSHGSSNNATAAVTNSSTVDDDPYYVTHSRVSSSAASEAVTNSSTADDDPYYVTHSQVSSSTASAIENPSSVDDNADNPEEPEVKPAAHATSTSDVAETGQDGEGEDEDSDEDEEEEEEKAPFQLLGEFLEAVMEEDYENAEKLCKMVLLYEPENAEAKQFQPLIEEMLKREREAQLWGSGSEDDSDDSDDSDEEDSDDDDSDDDDESDDDDDSSSSEESDSAENADEEK